MEFKRKIYKRRSSYEIGYNPAKSIISSASKTLTSFNFFNNFSLDQNGQSYFKANATYSVSFSCPLSNILALDKYSLNSSEETILILFFNNESNILKSSLESLDLFNSSFLCFSNSTKSSSGAIGSIFPEKIISAVLPFANNAEQMTFASITTSIHINPENFPLYFSCIDEEILFAIDEASFSVNLDFLTMDLNKANSESFSLIASLATSLQFIILNSSISLFKSSVTDKVIVGILTSKIFNIFNTHNSLFKSLHSGGTGQFFGEAFS